LTSGSAYSHFSQEAESSSYAVRTLSFPQQIGFDTVRFGTSFQYQPTFTSGGYALGQSFRGNARLSYGSFQLSGYAQRESDALSLSSIFSQIPSLQLELARLGITVSNPQQLSDLLQDAAFLQSLGLALGTTLHMVPLQYQAGANLTWTSHASRPQRLV